MKTFANSPSSDSQLIENSIKKYLDRTGEYYDVLWESMRYSVSAGGKRVRPQLTLDFCRLCGGDVEKALPFACGVEFIHTYSLIHDDLPCMDNDDLRRGKPSNHIAFSEDTALLAGDALQSLAFEVMLSDETVNLCGGDKAAKAAGTLARLCGADGMVGGQVIDLQYEDKPATEEIIRKMHLLKTSALIKSACLMGCIVAGASEEQLCAASEYADCIGLTFQLVDDVLDVTSTDAELGKPINSDKDNNKSTMVSLLGIDECMRRAKELTDKAIEALSVFKGDTEALKSFALKLLNRKN